MGGVERTWTKLEEVLRRLGTLLFEHIVEAIDGVRTEGVGLRPPWSGGVMAVVSLLLLKTKRLSERECKKTKYKTHKKYAAYGSPWPVLGLGNTVIVCPIVVEQCLGVLFSLSPALCVCGCVGVGVR